MKTSFLSASLFSFAFLTAFSADAQTLKVGTEPTFAPFEMQDPVTSEITGFDIELIKEIAKAEGLDVEIINSPFDALIPGIITGQIDIVAAGVSITDERAKVISFSAPYYKSGISAVVRAEDANKFTTLDSLKNSTLCAQIGTTGAKYAEQLSGKVVNFNTVPEAFLELKNKGCDATLNDRPVNTYFLIKSGKENFHEVSEIANGEDYGFVVSKDNSQLLDKINSGLKTVVENGTYEALYQKWFSSDAAAQ